MVPQQHVQCVPSDLLVEAVLDQQLFDVVLRNTVQPPVQFVLEKECCEFLCDLRLWFGLEVERLLLFVSGVH